MNKLHKTKTDDAGRSYYLLECPNCYELYEKRVDHIKDFACDCTPKPITQKLIRYRNKNILNAPEQTVFIKTATECQFKKILKTLAISNLILNSDIKQTRTSVKLQGGTHGSLRFKQMNASLAQ